LKRAALQGALRVWRALRGLLAEPLVHFMLAGAALICAERIHESLASGNRIQVTAAHVRQLARQYALQFGSHPDAQTLEALIRRDIDEEILYRQGLALKLDQDDEIVRRRIVQKMQFLMQDLSVPTEPTPAQLQAYYRAHQDRYATPARVSFSHIYFSPDRDGEAAARARAQAVVAMLPERTTRAPERGDPFPDLYDFSAYDAEQIQRLFGRTPFASAVLLVAPGRWAGPFRSGYGWHLIYVDSRESPSLPPLSAVREAVRRDYLEEAQAQANGAAFDQLARRFKVVREDRAPP